MERLVALVSAALAVPACPGQDPLHPEAQGALQKEEDAAPRPAHTVGVYYYPWHGGDFHGRKYLRERLVPRQRPELGEYDDREDAVIQQHVEWSRQAGIDLWVASWWGPDSREDVTLSEHVFAQPDLGGVRIAIHYETVGLTDHFTAWDRFEPDFTYLAETYFGHDACFRIDGRPVVVVYVTRELARRNRLDAAVQAMRAGARAQGHDVYLIGDHCFRAPPRDPDDDRGMRLLDAVTNYDVYGSFREKGYAGQAGVDLYVRAQAAWREAAHRAGARFVPTVTPGFNDKAVRDGHAPLARKLSPEAEFGSLFRALLIGNAPLADPELGGLVLVTSFNEWHEDTTIEPVAAAPPTDRDDAGQALTAGLAYEGYGKRYLEILRDELGE